MTTDNQTPYPIIENARMVDEESVSDFMDTLFSRVRFKPHHFINLRGIGEKGTEKEGKAHLDEWIQPALEHDPDAHVVDEAVRHVKRWAQWHIASFVVPAVLKAARGTSENVELMPAVVVDMDAGDTNAKAAWLEQHIGRPTMAVLSGGTTDAGTPKLHLYWVLEEPEADIGRVIEARHVLAEKIGGDLQFGRGTPQNPLGRAHQPIRIGGSVHAKHGRATTVRVPFYRGPVYEFALLAEAIRRAPASPWRIVAPQPVLGLDFGPTKNCRPDIDEAFAEDVYEGGEGENTRFNKLGKVIGGMLVQARLGKVSMEEARAGAYAWMQVHMKPPYDEAVFNNHWFRLLEREQASKGAIVPPPQLPPAKAMVTQADLGLREWAVHRWTRDEPKPRQFLVEGLVLAGKPHLVVAEGGAGKTFSMLDLGLKVAAWEEGGEPLTWWGQPIQQGGTVVMLTTEDDADELHIRIHDIDPQGLRFRAGDRWVVAPLANMGGAFTLGERDPRTGNVVAGARWLQTLELLRGLPDVKLVIVDTLNTTLHGDENSAVVVGEYAKLLQPVCGEIGAALVVTHHIRKTDPNNPIHSVDEMAAAVRGSSALPAAFRAVLGVWHCHDFAKRMKALGLEPKAKQLWRMGVLKANNPEMVDGVRFLLRQETGMLEDATAAVKVAQTSTGAQHKAWLVLAVRLAAEAGYPYSIGGKNDASGLFKRRHELPPMLRELGWRALDGVREDVIAAGDVVVGSGKGSRARTLMDVPDGPFSTNARGEEVKAGAMQVPEWGGWVWSDAEETVVPVSAPTMAYGG